MRTKHMKWKAGAFVVAFFLCATAITTANATVVLSRYAKQEICVPVAGDSYQILWTRIVTDGDYSDTTGGKVATDSNNNVIVDFKSGATGERKIIKYGPNNEFIWDLAIDINGTTNITEYELYEEGMPMPLGGAPAQQLFRTQIEAGSRFDIWSIHVDSEDNIIVVIDHLVQFEDPQKNDVVVMKYDPDGNEIWKNSYTYLNFLTTGCDGIVDSQGNIYVPCFSLSGAYVMKLDTDGDVCWFKSAKTLPVWFPFSIVLDANENPIMTTMDCAVNPGGSTVPIGFTKFSKLLGIKIADSSLDLSLDGLMFSDAALTVDDNNNVYFGLGGHIYKIAASLQSVIWTIEHPYYINDLKVVDDRLITCGGLCEYGENIEYYSAVYNTNTRATLLQMRLGNILYCTDPYFQLLLNQLKGMSIDNQGDFLFAGGEGGLIIVKVRITSGGNVIPNEIAQMFSTKETMAYQIET